MSVTVLGMLFIPATLICVLRGRRDWLPWVLAAGMPLTTCSAVVFGSNKVSPFFVAAFAALWFVVIDGKRRWPSGVLVPVLVLMTGYMVLSSVILPTVFAGINVLVPRAGIDAQTLEPGTLTFSVSNVAQASYLLLAASVVLFIASNPPPRHFINAGFAIGTVLNVWALANQLYGIPFPSEIFDAGVDGAIGGTSSFNGTARLRGVFSEPSYLATFSLAALLFNAFLLRTTDVRGRKWVLAMVVANSVALVFSYSGTAVASATVVILLVLFALSWQFATGTLKPPPLLTSGLLFGGAIAALFSGLVSNYVSVLVGAKVGGSSYVNRNSSNSFSWDLFLQTGGFGAGLGSSRPSSFFFMLISTVGLIGLALFVLLVAMVVIRAAKAGGFAPEIWALFATLVAKVIAEPNMSQTVLWMSIAACAVAFKGHAASEPLTGEHAPPTSDRAANRE